MNKNILVSSVTLIVASLFFVINDAIINFLSPLNIKFYHFVFYGSPAYLSVSFYLLITKQLKNKMRSSNYLIPILRGLIFIPMPILAFICLANISLPEYTTLMMSAPIFSGVLGAIFLKEKLNIYILLSLLLGFIGVIFVIKPGFQKFNIFFLLVLLSAFLIVITNILVNKYNTIISSEGFFIYGGIPIHLICFFLFLKYPLSINLTIFLLISLASILVNSAIFLNIYAFKNSQKYYASISNLIYLQILWSSIIGLIFFNEYLNIIAILGAFFIILSGIISIPAQIKQLNEN